MTLGAPAVAKMVDDALDLSHRQAASPALENRHSRREFDRAGRAGSRQQHAERDGDDRSLCADGDRGTRPTRRDLDRTALPLDALDDRLQRNALVKISGVPLRNSSVAVRDA